MPPVRFRGPICQTQDWYDTILDGTLARMPTPSPATIGSPATEDASEQHPPAQASGACSFLNYQGSLWNSAEAVQAWRATTTADNRLPSPYAGNNAGDDFCEFHILYNTSRGTTCDPPWVVFSAMNTDRLEIVQGDITKVPADAIVNAASHSLLGYAGVSGAIFQAAGQGLHDECAQLGECSEGDAVITNGYRLPVRHIIHTVGPVWYGGFEGEDARLARCYERCFALIVQHGHRIVAFPSIGTGAHGFPVERAARIALGQIACFLAANSSVERILVVCFDRATFDCYQQVRRELDSEATT